MFTCAFYTMGMYRNKYRYCRGKYIQHGYLSVYVYRRCVHVHMRIATAITYRQMYMESAAKGTSGMNGICMARG